MCQPQIYQIPRLLSGMTPPVVSILDRVWERPRRRSTGGEPTHESPRDYRNRRKADTTTTLSSWDKGEVSTLLPPNPQPLDVPVVIPGLKVL